ncbi:MAG: AAA family ATPase [Magnetococcus sp. YQC-3]
MRVIAFYSFKGGVGRTALLVNLATYWATQGRVVAVVDMDLAAPGISYSPLLDAHPILPDAPDCGVHELLAAYYQEKSAEDPRLFGFSPPSQLLRRMRPPAVLGERWPRDGAVLVLPAGEMPFQAPSWLEQGVFSSISPRKGRKGETPEEKSWRAFATLFRQDLEAYRLEIKGEQRPIDLLLLDCRTGWLELLNLSLGYLADNIVLVSGINQQNQAGLRHTLQALRQQEEPRIPFNQYATLTVVFSPMPANFHDDPESQQALQQGLAILEEYRIPPPEGQQREAPPPVFSLPYTTRLLHSDEPLYPAAGRDHPYLRVIVEIAERLVPREGDLHAGQREVKEEVVRVVGTRTPPTQIKPATDAGEDPLFSLANKWYWPWIGVAADPQAAGWERMREFLQGEEPSDLLDCLLDGLCAAISLDQEGKREILEKLPGLGEWQRRELVAIFDRERQQAESLAGQFATQHRLTLFERKKEWATLLLGDASGVEQFFKQLDTPLLGRTMGEREGDAWSRLERLAINPLIYGREGENDFQRAVSADEKDASFWWDLACRLDHRLNRYEDAEAAYLHIIELDKKAVGVWNNLGLLYWYRLRRCQSGLDCFNQGLQQDPDDAYLRINRGHLCLMVGMEWRTDLEQARAGFSGQDSLGKVCGYVFTSVELGMERDEAVGQAITGAMEKWPEAFVLLYGAVVWQMAMGRGWLPFMARCLVAMQSHVLRYGALSYLYLLAGARPDLSAMARQAAGMVFALSPEKLASLRGVPNTEMIERFRPFVEGRSDGAGDPRDLPLFCVESVVP